MKPAVLLLWCGIIFPILATSHLQADQLLMQNGDRYTGKVLSISADTVLLQNDTLGKINLPRAKVASMAFGTNALASAPVNAAPGLVPTNLPDASSISALVKNNTNAASNEEIVKNIREQLLAGSPEAAAKYDELATGLLSGKLDVKDIRREAKSAADQLRELKKELGPEIGDSLDGYLEILDHFLNETTAEPTNKTPAAQSKPSSR